MSSSALHALLRRDRQVVLAALAAVALVSWVYTVLGVGTNMPDMAMTGTGGPDAPVVDAVEHGVSRSDGAASGTATSGTVPTAAKAAARWSATESALMLAMWWIMMIAMMLPSAAPVILLAAAIDRRARAARPPYGSTSLFALGYLLAWLAFSVAAVLVHWRLERSGLLDATMRSSSAALSGALLLAAGLWQLTPIKHACLRHCRSPVRFLVEHRHRGALLTGLHHGLYCLGCCWFLMLLLFVGGVMSVLWIGGLALFVIAEKRWAQGERFGRVSGALLTLSGASLLLYALGR